MVEAANTYIAETPQQSVVDRLMHRAAERNGRTIDDQASLVQPSRAPVEAPQSGPSASAGASEKAPKKRSSKKAPAVRSAVEVATDLYAGLAAGERDLINRELERNPREPLSEAMAERLAALITERGELLELCHDAKQRMYIDPYEAALASCEVSDGAILSDLSTAKLRQLNAALVAAWEAP
jgi:hypothetical protein